jgi:hypothetical protein
VPVIKDGVHAVEIDLQTLELRIRGQSLRALDSDMACEKDIVHLFGTSAGTMQCTVDGENENRKSRYLVGVGYLLEYWTHDRKLMEMYEDFDRDYDPSELFPSEEWISEASH